MAPAPDWTAEPKDEQAEAEDGHSATYTDAEGT